MQLTWYLAASAVIATTQASPHPAYQQQVLDTLVSPAPPSLASPNNEELRPEDVISKDPLLSFHRDLIKIESISGNEHAISNFLADFLREQNFTVVKQAVPPVKAKDVETDESYDEETDPNPRSNIYAYPNGHPDKPSVFLTSHIDTPDTSSQHTDDLIIAGRGSVDAKASVAAQIFAALETLAANPSASLGLLFVVGEEIGGDGMKTFSRSTLNTEGTYHTVIFGEPTEAALVSGHKGMVGFEVYAHGKAAHSGYPWLGKSAVSAILPALTRVDQLGSIPASEGGLPSSPKYGQTTLNVGVVRAGVATNVVPSEAWADVSVRLAAGTPEEARAIIREAVANVTADVEAEVVVDFSHHLEAYEPQDLDTDVPGFDVIPVNYGTDVPALQVKEGVKRYLYGPGTIFVAHGDNEALTVGELKDAVVGYKKLIAAALERETAGLV
ncbi:hypothetical protein N7470_009870 [Penicillium chermesinum]|nr:hypothetical protein N7470_009870 [Penicillium chermesinum]